METAEQGLKAAEETKEPVKNHTQEEVKKQERERKEREARKEKEARERKDKEERAKKERERDERARREREKREEERKEWERRERERRMRKRAHGEGVSGLRSSCKLEGYKQSSWKDEQPNNSEAETKTVSRHCHGKKT